VSRSRRPVFAIALPNEEERKQLEGKSRSGGTHGGEGLVLREKGGEKENKKVVSMEYCLFPRDEGSMEECPSPSWSKDMGGRTGNERGGCFFFPGGGTLSVVRTLRKNAVGAHVIWKTTGREGGDSRVPGGKKSQHANRKRKEKTWGGFLGIIETSQMHTKKWGKWDTRKKI